MSSDLVYEHRGENEIRKIMEKINAQKKHIQIVSKNHLKLYVVAINDKSTLLSKHVRQS